MKKLLITATLLLLISLKPLFAGVAKGVDVREVQTLLTLLCFNPGPIDGAWGNKTEKAAKDFFSKYSKFFKGYTSGDFTVSYGESELTEKATGTTAALATIELESIQAAYVMGAMTVSAAMSTTDNDNGVAGQEYNENTLAVSFAF